MVDSTNPRVIADNIKELTDKQIAQAAELVALGSYSATEVNTGMKLRDKPIYRKIFEVESLPNNTSVQIPHGIENLDSCVHLYGVMQPTQGQAGQPIPYGNGLLLRYNWTVIVVQANSDLSSNSAIIVIEYTKAAPSSLMSPNPDTRSLEDEPEVRDPEVEPDPIEEIEEKK